MSMIFLGVGSAYMGVNHTDKDGNVTSSEPPRWENDPKGGCIAIGKLNPETMEQDGPAEVFGDWDAAGYLARALELLKPNRQINIPDIKAVVQAASKAGGEDFFCEHCRSCNCRDCIINEWKEAAL